MARLRVAVPAERFEGERRVALVPMSVAALAKAGMEVVVESGAGAPAHYPDQQYEDAGASLANDQAELLQSADVVLKINKPASNSDSGPSELDLMREGAAIIAFLEPLTSPDLTERLRTGKITSFSMDAVPRIARAQSMDALSSMASAAGYKAVLIAAGSLGKYMPMMVTAAGTVAPAKGLILGAGVAGLQAIATARRLGAVLSAFDVRPAVKEQVESLGATFIEAEAVVVEAEHESGYAKELSKESQQRERELIQSIVADMDFVISTAAVPGKRAPILITEEMVKSMRPGSVIVDMAAPTGGNCELTKPGAEIVVHEVVIHGPLNIPGTMPTHASQLYSKNISNLLLHLVTEGQMQLDFEDEIVSGCCITHAGEFVHGPSLAAAKLAASQVESADR